MVRDSDIVNFFKKEDVKSIKEFEERLDSEEGKNFLKKLLSPYRADKIGFLRWAVTDPSGRQIFSFKKNNDTLEDDSEGMILSNIWYNLFLEHREDYLSERIWEYMVSGDRNKIRAHFVFNFKDGSNQGKNENNYTFPEEFLNLLDQGSNIHKLLSEKAKNVEVAINQEKKNNHYDKYITSANIMKAVRELRSLNKIVDLQQAGIRRTLKEWLTNSLGNELNKIFTKFYSKELNEERRKYGLKEINEINEEPITSEDIPFHYKLASKFLFMWQNIAIFYPDVSEIHIFAYISVNRARRSSLHLFFEKSQKTFDKDNIDNIYTLLGDIESAMPYNPEEKRENNDNKNYPLWSSAFKKLPNLLKNEEKQKDKCQAK